MFNLFRKCDDEKLKELEEDMIERIDSVRRENKKLRRILQNYIPGKITYLNDYTFDGEPLNLTLKRYVRLYCNGNEYNIDKIERLYNPIFLKNENGTIVISDYQELEIEGEKTGRDMEYIVNLSDNQVVRTK